MLLRLTTVVVFTTAFINSSAYAEKFASIIIDDIGNHLQNGKDIINLPAALTVAILPGTNYATTLAHLANNKQKEVMLHLPMQSVEHHKLSPGTLGLHMTEAEFNHQLQQNLNSVPYVRGINNHMGSLLTRHPGHMSWLMSTLSSRGDLYFIDSRTTSKTVAGKIAAEYDIPSLTRDFFLDPDARDDTLQKQFDQFINKVNQRGYALAIAHPYPKTIQFLQQHLKELKAQGITLVPVSKLIQTANQHIIEQESKHVACTGTPCAGL